MKAIFACPTYGPTDPQADRSRRIAVMHAASNGITWLGDASPDRVKFDASRNLTADSACCLEDADDDTRVFWCDSDVILPHHAITTLILSGYEFITGIYFQRGAPHFPLVATFNRQKESFNWIADWPENVIAPADGCGFGCVVTSVGMLRKMRPGPWFTFQKYSEDFDFCLRAASLGYRLHVHTGVLCGHLADPVPIVKSHWDVEREKLTHGAIRSGAA